MDNAWVAPCNLLKCSTNRSFNPLALFGSSRCTPPNKSNDYQKIYSDWCHEFEKYKSAMKSWEKKQAKSQRLILRC
uniref:Uncharacterized protein n=1 Tax=Lutzomyia longipalpis TaxID=7200 RepID=A0A1B0GJS2_LUTLO